MQGLASSPLSIEYNVTAPNLYPKAEMTQQEKAENYDKVGKNKNS